MADPSPRGTYLRVAEALRQRLSAGDLQHTLPSEAALMGDYGVSRTTVRRALQALAAEGLLQSRPGIGWQTAASQAPAPLVDRVRTAIAEDGFEVGSTFHSEASLCERFQTSRTSVRRALAQLEGEGLLEAVHGKGRLVKALPPALEGS
ncbi:GntR family transcriptional regulator [Streptomyces abikoensis]|uniref:GntR family transcriptional regulator n=1 Tax=Streptomyces TaxID=1883 RepID=UPI0033CA744C